MLNEASQSRNPYHKLAKNEHMMSLLHVDRDLLTKPQYEQRKLNIDHTWRKDFGRTIRVNSVDNSLYQTPVHKELLTTGANSCGVMQVESRQEQNAEQVNVMVLKDFTKSTLW